MSIQRQSPARHGPSETRSETPSEAPSEISERRSEAGVEEMTEAEMRQVFAELEAMVAAAEAVGAA